MDAERPFVAKRVQTHGPEWDVASKAIRRAMRLTAELNKLSFDDAAKVRELFSELTGRKVVLRSRVFRACEARMPEAAFPLKYRLTSIS